MGRIIIEAYRSSGTVDDSYVPVYSLGDLDSRNADATTTTTAESVALGSEVTLLRIYGDVAHRLGLTDASVANSATYITTPAAQWFDLAVPKGTTLYYRMDA